MPADRAIQYAGTAECQSSGIGPRRCRESAYKCRIRCQADRAVGSKIRGRYINGAAVKIQRAGSVDGRYGRKDRALEIHRGSRIAAREVEKKWASRLGYTDGAKHR